MFTAYTLVKIVASALQNSTPLRKVLWSGAFSLVKYHQCTSQNNHKRREATHESLTEPLIANTLETQENRRKFHVKLSPVSQYSFSMKEYHL